MKKRKLLAAIDWVCITIFCVIMSKIIRGMTQYKKYALLIIDEWLLYPLKETECRDQLEIMESRYKRASTIVYTGPIAESARLFSRSAPEK